MEETVHTIEEWLRLHPFVEMWTDIVEWPALTVDLSGKCGVEMVRECALGDSILREFYSVKSGRREVWRLALQP
mgnify:FL=1